MCARFDLSVSTIFSCSDEPVPCLRRCAMSVSSEHFLLMALKEDGQMITIDLTKVTHARIIDHSLTLERNNIVEYSFLFTRFSDFVRFVCALMESGVMIPTPEPLYIISPKHSFVPIGDCSFESKDIRTLGIKALQRHIEKITPEKPPFDEKYLDIAVIEAHSRLMQQCKKWLANHPRQIVSKWPVKASTLLGCFRQIITHKDGAVKKLLWKVRRPGNLSPETLKLLAVVNQDATRTWTTDPKWTDEKMKVGIEICRASISSGHEFIQGEFDIAQRCVLLYEGSSGIPGDNETVPERLLEMTSEEKTDRIYALYKKLVAIIENYYNDIMSAVLAITKATFDITEKAAVTIRKWYLTHGMVTLMWSGNDLTTLYNRSFKDVWRLWLWLIQGDDDSYKKLIAFSAAVNVYALPVFVERKYTAISDVMVKGGWDTIIDKLDLGELLDLATYFYKKYI